MRRTLYGHLALARVSNSPTVVSNTLAGATLAGARQVDGKVALVAMAMVLFYSAGMYLNDLLDYAVDCRERPKRPLPAGIVSQRAALVGVIALFGCGSVLLLIVGLYAFLSGLGLVVLIICYDRWHKGNPFGPVLMALCRGMVYVTAFLAFSAQSFFDLFFPCCLLILYVIGLTSVAKIEAIHQGRRKAPSPHPRTPDPYGGSTPSAGGTGDIEGCDRHAIHLGRRKAPSPHPRTPDPYGGSTPLAGGTGDIEGCDRHAIHLGRRKAPSPHPRTPDPYGWVPSWLRGTGDIEGRNRHAIQLANVGIMVTLFLPAVYFVLQPSLLSLLFDLIFAVWVLYSIIFIYDSPTPQVGRAVGQLIAGIALLDGLVLLAWGNYHGLLLAVVAFGLTLFLQRYVKGT
jgi:hypothetical protein